MNHRYKLGHLWVPEWCLICPYYGVNELQKLQELLEKFIYYSMKYHGYCTDVVEDKARRAENFLESEQWGSGDFGRDRSTLREDKDVLNTLRKKTSETVKNIFDR